MYKPGEDNRVTDALSRRGHETQLLSISSAVPSWLEEVSASYTDDPKAQGLLAKLALSDTAVPNFSLHQGLIRHKGRI